MNDPSQGIEGEFGKFIDLSVLTDYGKRVDCCGVEGLVFLSSLVK